MTASFRQGFCDHDFGWDTKPNDGPPVYICHKDRSIKSIIPIGLHPSTSD
jgi:hypothetical protein